MLLEFANEQNERHKNEAQALVVPDPVAGSSAAIASKSNGSTMAPISILNRKLSKLHKRAMIDIDFSNLTYSVPGDKKEDTKTILKGISGKFSAGQLTAILGPSGAGKTSLMNILAGFRKSRVSGDILVNGRERAPKLFRRKSCYIMQEDHLLPFLSVQESMDGAATLKLGGKVAQTERNIVIDDILDMLNLKDSRLTRVANLSGGEKKRLSIALELVNNPPIMFFDEPTSGLDSRSSYLCINLLKSLAEEGRTIICTIHQPPARMFEKFDHLYALSEGQCIYQGTIHQLVPFLSSLSLECPSYHNPADFLIEIAFGEYGSFIPKLVDAVNNKRLKEQGILTNDGANNNQPISRMKSSEGNSEIPPNERNDDYPSRSIGDCVYSSCQDAQLELQLSDHSLLTNHRVSRIQITPTNSREDDIPDYPASFYTQFIVLFKRTFLSLIRDTLLTKLRIFVHLSIAIFVGLLFYNIGNEASKVQSNIGCLFFSPLFLIFTTMMPTILTFPLEKNIFIKEHLNHWYSLKAYYFAKTVADTPFEILFPLLYIVIMYFMTSQPFEMDRFCLYTTLCILVSLVAQSIGLLIGAALNIQQSAFFGPASIIPGLLISGFFVTFSTIPGYLKWMTYLSYVRYGYEGSIIAIYGGKRENLDCSEAFCMFKHTSKILEVTDIEESYLWLDFLMLVVFFVAIRISGYFVLRWKLRKER